MFLFRDPVQKLSYCVIMFFLFWIGEIGAVEDETKELSEKTIGSYSIFFASFARSLEYSLKIWFYLRVVKLKPQ